MVNMEKEACPEKKDFLSRERPLSKGIIKFYVSHSSITVILMPWCFNIPGLLDFAVCTSAGVVSDVSL